MTRTYMLEMLSERHKTNRYRIRAYSKYENLDGTPISKGHASTALSNARKEQLIVELLKEVIEVGPVKYNLSDRAIKGFCKLTEPAERHFSKDEEGFIRRIG